VALASSADQLIQPDRHLEQNLWSAPLALANLRDAFTTLLDNPNGFTSVTLLDTSTALLDNPDDPLRLHLTSEASGLTLTIPPAPTFTSTLMATVQLWSSGQVSSQQFNRLTIPLTLSSTAVPSSSVEPRCPASGPMAVPSNSVEPRPGVQPTVQPLTLTAPLTLSSTAVPSFSGAQVSNQRINGGFQQFGGTQARCPASSSTADLDRPADPEFNGGLQQFEGVQMSSQLPDGGFQQFGLEPARPASA
jgi:hypothetical protein